MNIRVPALLLIILVLTTGCVKHKLSDLIKVGQTKSEIIQLIGDTSEKRFITKRNNQIYGPEKEFWHEIQTGTKLEQWTYYFEDEGTLTLYFIGKSNELKYKAFEPGGSSK